MSALQLAQGRLVTTSRPTVTEDEWLEDARSRLRLAVKIVERGYGHAIPPRLGMDARPSDYPASTLAERIRKHLHSLGIN